MVNARERIGYNQKEAASAAGIKQARLSNFESDSRTLNGWDVLRNMARGWRTSADYILGLTDDPAPASNRDLPLYGAPMLEIMRQLTEDQSAMLLAQARAILEYSQAESEQRAYVEMITWAIGESKARQLIQSFHDRLTTDGPSAANSEFKRQLLVMWGLLDE